jgi:hypothetical protein
MPYHSLEFSFSQLVEPSDVQINVHKVLEHHEREYSLTRLIMSQMDKFFTCLKCLSTSRNA